jgi:peroxiredoxin
MVAALLAVPAAAQPARTLPPRVADVHGNAVDLAALAEHHRVFLISLKTVTCPVCREQLTRLRKLLPRLRACGATFVVVAPGSQAAVAALAEESGFPFPFIADSDRRVARAANLVRVAGEMEPAVLEVDGEGTIIWERRGRASGAYSDPALLERLDCVDGLSA